MMIEGLLHDAAYTQDKQYQQNIIQELVRLSADQSVVSKIADVFMDADDGAIEQVALRVLEAIGYPGNAAAIPTLVQCVAYNDLSDPTGPASWVLHMLIRLGTGFLPRLMALAEKDNDIEGFVYDALVNAWGLYWQSIEQGNTQLMETLVHELAQHPDDVLDFLVFVLARPLKEWWEEAVNVIIAIGYPRNSKALPQLIWVATDGNTPGSREAFDYLRSLDVAVMVPHLNACVLDSLVKPEETIRLN
jgi:hypothetical protein